MVDPVVVGGQLIGLAVQRKFRPADAVGIPAHQGPQGLAVGPVGLQRVEAQEDVHRLARPIRDAEGLERAAEGDDLAGERPGGQRVELDGRTVRHCAERNGNRHGNTLFPI